MTLLEFWLIYGCLLAAATAVTFFYRKRRFKYAGAIVAVLLVANLALIVIFGPEVLS